MLWTRDILGWFGVNEEDIAVFLSYHQFEKMYWENGTQQRPTERGRGSYWENPSSYNENKHLAGDDSSFVMQGDRSYGGYIG
jgi:hypothetical protein